MKKYILAVDQSTTATKAILFDNSGKLIKRVDVAHKQIMPKPGWVEHDAIEIYDNLINSANVLMDEYGCPWQEIAAFALSNQRETVVVWDKTTGKPVYNAIVWQCSRAKEICESNDIKKAKDAIFEKTGLMLSPFFSAPKIKWILDHVPGARDKAEAGDLLAGTMDSFLVWKLSHGKYHITDYSNASRTMLLNLTSLEWDEELLNLFGIPLSMMAKTISSDQIAGYTDFEGASDVPIPVCGIMGDSHGAMFAQNCYQQGMTKVTYGTGSSIMMNIGNEPVLSRHGLVTSIAWGMKQGVEYVLEGNINYAAATIKWLVDDIGLLENAEQSEELASSINNNGGVYMVPAFTGLGAPHWDNDANAIICGMRAGTKKENIVRAALESIVYQICDIIDCMESDIGTGLKEIRVDGGPTRNSFLMQFQSDMLQCDVNAAGIEELSAMGCALMAGLAVGLWNSKDELISIRAQGAVYHPNMSANNREKYYSGWKNAVMRARVKLS